MIYFKVALCLALVCLSCNGVYGGMTAVDPTQVREGKGGFLDDLFGGLEDGLHLDKIVNQGSSIVSKVQKVQGGTSIVKTQITQFSSSGTGGFPPIPQPRFKRGVMDEVFGNLEDKIGHATNKVTGVVSDGINIGYAQLHNLKEKVNNRIRE